MPQLEMLNMTFEQFLLVASAVKSAGLNAEYAISPFGYQTRPSARR